MRTTDLEISTTDEEHLSGVGGKKEKQRYLPDSDFINFPNMFMSLQV